MNLHQFENLYSIPHNKINGPNFHEGKYMLRPQDSVSVIFDKEDVVKNLNENYRYKLRLTGEVGLYSMWRTEASFQLLYRLLDDSLSTNTHHSPYCLNVESEDGKYPLMAWYKVNLPVNTAPFFTMKNYKGELDFSIWHKNSNVKLQKDGRVCFIIEVFSENSLYHPDDINRTPNKIYTLGISEENCCWKKSSMKINIEGNTSCVLVHLAGENFTGKLQLEDPFLGTEEKYNLLPSFAPAAANKHKFNWLGLNFSKKEWPEFDVCLNGERVFTGPLFNKIYRWPTNEVEIPEGLMQNGQNLMTIKYLSNYRDTLPYMLKKVEIITLPDEVFNIVACPSVVDAEDEFTILIYTSKEDIEIHIESDNKEIQSLNKVVTLTKPDYHTVRFKASKAGKGANITFKCGNYSVCSIIERIVKRQNDGVLAGSGDAVYIPQNIDEMKHFIAWNLHHQIGNAISFRPCYRWTGTRTLNEEMWRQIVDFCDNNKIYYCNMIDGRELPGCSANPSPTLLEGQYYMGAQTHEKDGTYYYWGTKPVPKEEELYNEVWNRLASPGGIFAVTPMSRTSIWTFRHINPIAANNMEEAANNFIEHISKISPYASRHTGPSVLFKYFYQAGFKWQGAEIMYGPHELVFSALRGASLCYGTEDFGSHIAIQWSTSPHDTVQRYRRYFLSLYTCYMQGVNHINTEEGLWRMEQDYVDYERFDDACISHRKIHQAFYKFIRTHTRRGKIHTPIAFIQGRFDGWTSFTQGNVWMQQGKEWEFSYPEKSWDMLKVFYPLSKLSSIYEYPCKNESNGLYSGTPYGNVDIIPVESDVELLNKYDAISFLGWNSALNSDIDKLYEYVRNGGRLLLGWPHLYATTKRGDTLKKDTVLVDKELIENLLGVQFNGFTDVKVDNYNLTFGKVELISATALKDGIDGIPSVIENKIGKGSVTFVNIKAYPSEEYANKLYEEVIRSFGEYSVMKEQNKGWMKCPEEVGFTVFDREHLRIIYILNINWWDEENTDREATLLWGNGQRQLNIGRDELNIVTLSENWAVWTNDNETDVMDIMEDEEDVNIGLQGIGEITITLLSKNSPNNINVKGVDIINKVENGMWKIKLSLEGKCELEISKA